MFTGIVEESGSVLACVQEGRTARITVQASVVHEDAKLGDSITVNGCCLTVVQIANGALTFDAIPETMARTNLGRLRPGDSVNLERSMAANGRFGGHIVQGHIDGVGTVLSLQTEENAVIMEVGIPEGLRRYFIEKGSITIDGVSLTVVDVLPESFTVWTIPHTREVTTLGKRQVGDLVNLEVDLVGKYIERLLSERK